MQVPSRPPESFACRLALVVLLGAAPLGAQVSDTLPAPVRPSFGSGLVWVDPLPMTPRELASLLSGKPEEEITDSLAAALTQHFLAAVAEAQALDSMAGYRPDWTTSIAGQPVGLDDRWIYLGPIRLPTMLLALLPIDVMPNPTEAAMARKRAAMREDILTAGRRSANLAEFAKAVKALRAQREAEREFERNRRTPPEETEPPE